MSRNTGTPTTLECYMGRYWKHVAMMVIGGVSFAASSSAKPPASNGKSPSNNGKAKAGYEVWAADQANTVSGGGQGTRGSLIWVWDSADIEAQLAGGPTALPVGCDGNNSSHANRGPCDVLEVFPQDLVEHAASGPTGNELGSRPGFGRLHGMIPDPQNKYFTANLFAPGGGYVGIIDAQRKEAIALFRVTQMSTGRSVHMSFWNSDGSSIVIANLDGKTLERIDVQRNGSGKIMQASFNRSASLALGKNMSVVNEATVFLGKNHHNRNMVGQITGSYAQADLGDLTPNGECKENGCLTGPDASNGGRPNTAVICPITTASDRGYVTLAGGGLFVADLNATPMRIVGEYGNQVVNGAGCAGVQTDNHVWINAGVSASAAGFNQSAFTMYVLDDSAFGNVANPPNAPAPYVAFKDPTNTTHLGNIDGSAPSNASGQLPGVTTRRDAHGAARTLDGAYVHNADRIRNVVEVFAGSTLAHVDSYDLTSFDGQGSGQGPCLAASVSDDPLLPVNDPAPDLLQATPDGKYMVVSLRGPGPITVNHSSQGSCPGVGIIELSSGGKRGRLLDVLRATNTLDTDPITVPGGHPYTGVERSDIHGASVISK